MTVALEFRRVTALSVLLWLLNLQLLTSYAWATNGIFPIAVDAQNLGRAGIDLGIANSSTAIHTNPAGIAFIPGKMADVAFGSCYPRIGFSNKYDDHVRADNELVPLGSFSMVWDAPGQILEIAGDPLVYTFGGEVTPSANATSTGDTWLEFPAGQLERQLTVVAQGMAATLSGLRIYAMSAADDANIVWAIANMPSLPAYAKVTALRVHFFWQTSQTGEIILTAEGKQAKLPLQPSQGWQEAYLVLVWNAPYAPAGASLSAPIANGIALRDLDITLCYEVDGQSSCKTLYRAEQPQSQANYLALTLLGSDAQAYRCSHDTSVTLALRNGQTLAVAPDTRIRLYYHYQLEKNVLDAFLKISVHGHTEAQVHLLPWAERQSHGRVWRRCVSDYQLPYPERSAGFKFGLGFFPQAGARYTLKTYSDLFPEGIDNRTDFIVTAFSPAIAYRFSDYFSIGVTLETYMERIEFDGVLSQNALILKGTPVNGYPSYGESLIGLRDVKFVRGEVDNDPLWGYGFGGRIGLLWKISDRIQVGAVYSPKPWMAKAKGKTRVDFTRHFEDPKISDITEVAKLFLPNNGQFGFGVNYNTELAFDLPQRAGAGVSFLVADNLVIGADFEWINYADTMVKLDISLKNGDNPDSNALLGSSSLQSSLRLGWKDQYVAGGAIVWQPFDAWIVRAGYKYGNNPVPREELNPQFAALIEHHVTLGISCSISEYLTVHLAAEGGLPSKLTSDNVNNVHEDFANSELTIYTVGGLLGMSWRF